MSNESARNHAVMASLYGRHLDLNELDQIIETQVAPVKARHYDLISATLDELVGHDGFPRSTGNPRSGRGNRIGRGNRAPYELIRPRSL